MSNDVSNKYLRSRAVKEAWEREAALVRKGKGTRNWTLAEQKELLETGRIKKYVGHHVKCVKSNPELAGDPANIQFLTRSEHYKAHLGNWKHSMGYWYDVNKQAPMKGEQFITMVRSYPLTERYVDSQRDTAVKNGDDKLLLKEKNEMNNEYEATYKGYVETVYNDLKSRFYNSDPQSQVSGVMQDYRVDLSQRDTVIALFREMKLGSDDLATAFSHNYAAKHFNSQVISKSQTANNGRNHIPEALKTFMEKQSERCDRAIGKCEQNAREIINEHKSLPANKQTENESKSRALYDARQKAAAFYEQQKAIWGQSDSRQLTKDYNQNKTQSNVNNKNNVQKNNQGQSM